jgi:hypothetical protein
MHYVPYMKFPNKTILSQRIYSRNVSNVLENLSTYAPVIHVGPFPEVFPPKLFI